MSLSFAQLAALRHRISLPIAKKAFGELEGAHHSMLTGSGQDFDDLAAYRPGDNVTRIDWKASARAGYPIIRRYLRQTNMSVLLCVDTCAAMRASAPNGEVKSQIAETIVDVIAYLSQARSDACGLVTMRERQLEQLPARVGTHHAELLRHHVRQAFAAPAAPSTLPALLGRIEALLRRRSMIVMITDSYALDETSAHIVKRLQLRHNLVLFQVADIAASDLAGARVRDVIGGSYPRFVLRDRQLISQLSAEQTRRRNEVAGRIKSLGLPATEVMSSDDILPALKRLAIRRQEGIAS